MMYKRLANAGSEAELRELKVELIDRFGLLPEPARYLFEVTRLKLQAEALGIIKIEASAGGGKLRFRQDTSIDPETAGLIEQSIGDRRGKAADSVSAGNDAGR
jgi:transcription-repair coupling factor (superfamily II helicase)